MPRGWEGNRRSGVALAMRHRLQWFIHLLAHGLRKGDEHPAYTPRGVWHNQLIKVSKTRHLTVKILSAGFAKTAGKNLRCLLKTDGFLIYVSKTASHLLNVDGEKNIKKILHVNVII